MAAHDSTETVSRRCTCVSCGECGGSGNVWFSFSGHYLGNRRCDDLDDLRTCEECGGSGLAEMCDVCQDERDLDVY